MKKNNKNDNSSKIKDNNNRDIVTELLLKKSSQNKFDIIEYCSKDECTSCNFGTLPIEQKGYICSVCDKKKEKFNMPFLS